MASVGGVPSPESTVTSLLASSGRLKSSLHPEPLHIIKYKDRHYESASDALDAYIADFQSSVSSVGQLELPKEQSTPGLLRSGYRNRDVLKESLTDQELNFLKLPTASKRRESDHISMTTDDLLLLPVDGSLPVTRTSAFLSQFESSKLENSSNLSSWSRSRLAGTPNKSLSSTSASRTLYVDDLLMGSLKPKHAPLHFNCFMSTKRDKQHSVKSHHLPRWMNSHKSEMEFSGVTSVPDLKYPAWLEKTGINVRTQNVPAWVNKLEGNAEESLEELKGQNGLIGLPDDNGVHFRGDKIGSLIHRAEDVLKSPFLGFYGSDKEQHGSPGNSEELLEADRSWDNPPVTFKSPVPVGCTDQQITTEESQKDAKEKCLGSFSSGYSSRKHPGPVEALKQMLFNLQAVEQRVTQQKEESQNNSSRPISDPLMQIENHGNDEVLRPYIEDSDLAPGGQSLKRALHHLGRLKNLVDEMNERRSTECKEDVVAGYWESLLIGDNTALNGIRLHCVNSLGGSGPYSDYATVQSDTGSWGKWTDSQWCNSGMLTSFQLRVEPYQGTMWDDTAANNIKFKCSGNDEEIKGAGMSWGDWGSWSDPCTGTGICGIQTIVEEPKGVGDDTALNDVRFYCCE